ncbi:MAG TPA: hypothetical protein PKK95_06165 [Vicinamibacterales bacterium]|nr:hypothetical protein [Vicinamibacterales bacterium]
MSKYLVAGLLALSFAFPVTSASAQERVTAVLKSGERVTGELVDLGGRDYTFRVNGRERRIRIADMAMIDFPGTAPNVSESELARAGQGNHVIVLRNGQTLNGRLVDISESSRPLVLHLEVNGERRRMTSQQVARIYMDQAGATATSGGGEQALGPGSRSIQVSATRAWTPTGITVRKGDIVRFSSSGEVRVGPNASDTSNVNGRPGAYAVRATAPRVLLGALIGRVGNGDPFGIGGQESVPMPDSGELFLGVNDANFGDNSGEFRVIVGVGAARTGERAIPRRRR